MSDFLLENHVARKVIQTLRLPLPVPTPLQREIGPFRERPLDDDRILVGGCGASPTSTAIAWSLARAGAMPFVDQDGARARFADPGEAYGRPCTLIDPTRLPAGLRLNGLVFDATEIGRPEDLGQLYAFFHPWVRHLKSGARIVVVGPSHEAMDVHAATVAMALEGFVRSLAKELGKRGTTAQLLRLTPGAEAGLEGPLRFFLSRRAAFITGQPLTVRAPLQTHGASWATSLAGKVALVTGAARGIGAATAEQLAAEGAHVICLDRPADDAQVSQVARAVRGTVLLADVGAPDTPQFVTKSIEERFGGVDIVVHNAGITRDKTLGRMSIDQWDDTLRVNLLGVAAMTDALLRGTLRDHGRLIVLSSVAGLAGNVGQTNYAASKAGLLGYVRALGPRLAERGITANAIAPGFIETRLTAAIPVAIREAARRLSSLGQGGQPRDVADAITFLATPQASSIQNQVLRVCGGALIGA